MSGKNRLGIKSVHCHFLASEQGLTSPLFGSVNDGPMVHSEALGLIRTLVPHLAIVRDNAEREHLVTTAQKKYGKKWKDVSDAVFFLEYRPNTKDQYAEIEIICKTKAHAGLFPVLLFTGDLVSVRDLFSSLRESFSFGNQLPNVSVYKYPMDPVEVGETHSITD